MHQFTYIVQSLVPITDKIAKFNLHPLSAAMDIKPGQYVMLTSENEQVPFSVAGFDGQTLSFHIKHGPENQTACAILDKLKVSSKVNLQGPFGRCSLPQNNQVPLYLIAGGTGIAPHKALIDKLMTIQSPNPTVLYWGLRSLEDYYLKAWFENLAHLPWCQAHLVLSEQQWDGPSMLVSDAFFANETISDHALVYASGPYPMVTAVKAKLDPKVSLLSDMLSD